MTVENQNNDSNTPDNAAEQNDKLAEIQAGNDLAATAAPAEQLASTDAEAESTAEAPAESPAAAAETSDASTEPSETAEPEPNENVAEESTVNAEAKSDAAEATDVAEPQETASDVTTDVASAEAEPVVEDTDDAAAKVSTDTESTTDAKPADDAKNAAGDSEVAAAADEKPAEDPKPEDTRDPRIPEVITQRTLFFLAPDLPPLPEAPRGRRNEPQDDQDDDSSDDDRSGRGRRNSRRGRRGGEQQRDDRSSSRDNQRNDRNARDNQRNDRSNTRDRDTEPQDDHDDDVIDEPQAVKGSTRLAAKRARRRESRELGRRRTVVTESEFQARRESVDRKMLVRAKDGRVQIGVLEDNILVEHYVARNEDVSLIGNVYLGRVQNVLPSMEAAFVDIGEARNAVLYSGEVDWSAAKLGPNTARKIENALKPGDKVLVQVTKDPVGHKGARLTSQISLPGRYLVYVPGNTLNGISRKLPESERSRLKKILKEVLPEGVGVIVRTAAEGATEEQLQRDVERLTRQWEDIQKQVASAGKGAKTLHAEPDMLIKIIRDVFNEDFHQLIIQGNAELETIKTYLGQVAPDLLERVEKYTGDDIFVEYKVNDMIDKALSRKVWLPSGGSLVIDRTEAMTVIDVNTGKFVGSGGNLEETVTKNNLEAAEEIIRQLRLRDIGGIIVIDFIDMVLESNRDLVHRRLVEGLSRDRTKHQVAEVTSLGLVQMTRKKIGLGLLETFSEPCAACAGRGVVIHSHPVNHGGGSSNQSKGKSSRRGKGQNDNGGNKNQSQKSNGNGNGTHEITEDTRNALTKIAASTMVAAKDDDSAREAAEKIADAAAAAASGKPADEVLAAAGETPSESNGEEREGRRSRRSRRGGRGRNKNNDQQQDSPAAEPNTVTEPNTAAEEAPVAELVEAPSNETVDPSTSSGTAPSNETVDPSTSSGTAPKSSKPRRRRVSTGTVTADASVSAGPSTSSGTGSKDAKNSDARRESALSIELPQAKEPAPKAEPKVDASVTLASLDAALDSLVGPPDEDGPSTSSGTGSPTAEPVDPSTSSGTGAANSDGPSTSSGAGAATGDGPSTSSGTGASSSGTGQAPKKRRRRITTGPISAE